MWAANGKLYYGDRWQWRTTYCRRECSLGTFRPDPINLQSPASFSLVPQALPHPLSSWVAWEWGYRVHWGKFGWGVYMHDLCFHDNINELNKPYPFTGRRGVVNLACFLQRDLVHETITLGLLLSEWGHWCRKMQCVAICHACKLVFYLLLFVDHCCRFSPIWVWFLSQDILVCCATVFVVPTVIPTWFSPL